MGNPIIEEFQTLGETVNEFQKTNDERLEAMAQGLDGKLADSEEKLAKLEAAIVSSQATIKSFEENKAKDLARIEMLEAMNERPRGDQVDQKQADYDQKFWTALRAGLQDPDANAEVKTAQKDVTIGSNIGGGFALPKQIGAEVDALLLKLSDIVNNVKDIQVGTSDYQELVSIHGGTSGWVAETGTRTGTGTPNLRSQKPTWGELYAYPTVSEWSLQDLFFDVAGWLTNDIAEGMANALSTAIFSGDGSDKPTGMTNTAPVATNDHASPLRAATAYEYSPVAGSPATSIGGDDLIDMVYLLNARYRQGAKFAMNTVTQGAVRKLKDSNGQYLWQPSLQSGQPDRLLGYEIFTWEDLGNPTTADALSVAFGDFRKAYLLTHRTELLIMQENVTAPGFVKFYVRRRYGGFPLNNDAVKLLKMADA